MRVDQCHVGTVPLHKSRGRWLRYARRAAKLSLACITARLTSDLIRASVLPSRRVERRMNWLHVVVPGTILREPLDHDRWLSAVT